MCILNTYEYTQSLSLSFRAVQIRSGSSHIHLELETSGPVKTSNASVINLSGINIILHSAYVISL